MEDANKECSCSAKRFRISHTKHSLASCHNRVLNRFVAVTNHGSVLLCVDLPSLGELRRERHRTSSFDIVLNLVSGVSTIMDCMFVIRRLSYACHR